MNAIRIMVVAGVFLTWFAVYAQNIVEYSTLGTKSTTLPNAIAATSHVVAKQGARLNGKLSDANSKNLPSSETNLQNHSQLARGLTPPTVFILFNGDRFESSNYLLTTSSLRVQQGEAQRTIPLDAINLDATIAANHERGVDLKIPKSKSEIVLSF
jgi:hypothetical protein